MQYYDPHTRDWLLYVGSSARPELQERIREHQQVKLGCQVVFAAQIPRAKSVETAMYIMLSPYRHRTLPDSFHCQLDVAYRELLPVMARQSDGRVLH
jgi:hypothetical protein